MVSSPCRRHRRTYTHTHTITYWHSSYIHIRTLSIDQSINQVAKQAFSVKRISACKKKKRRKKGKKGKKKKEKECTLVKVEGEPFEVGSMRSGSYGVEGYVCMYG